MIIKHGNETLFSLLSLLSLNSNKYPKSGNSVSEYFLFLN